MRLHRVVHGVDGLGILLHHHRPLQLQRRRQLVGVDREVSGEDRKALDAGGPRGACLLVVVRSLTKTSIITIAGTNGHHATGAAGNDDGGHCQNKKKLQSSASTSTQQQRHGFLRVLLPTSFLCPITLDSTVSLTSLQASSVHPSKPPSKQAHHMHLHAHPPAHAPAPEWPPPPRR